MVPRKKQENNYEEFHSSHLRNHIFDPIWIPAAALSGLILSVGNIFSIAHKAFPNTVISNCVRLFNFVGRRDFWRYYWSGCITYPINDNDQKLYDQLNTFVRQ